MSTIHLFHGTTFEAVQDIIENGFDCVGNSVWSCSDNDCVYFYQLDKFVESECIEDESLEEQIYRCELRANEQGQIANAVLSDPYDLTCVIHLEIDTENFPTWEDNIMEDDSCPYAGESGAVCIESRILNELISERKVRMKVIKYEFIVKMSLAYITGLKDNPYFQDKFSTLSYSERAFVYALIKSDFYCEELLTPERINEIIYY